MTTSEPKQVIKKAIDVTPYYHGIWCTVGGSEPMVNTVVARRWSDDGKSLWFMLDTHNFDRRDPDEEILVVELNPDVSDQTKKRWAKLDETMLLNRPIPTKECPHCRGKGRIEDVDYKEN